MATLNETIMSAINPAGLGGTINEHMYAYFSGLSNARVANLSLYAADGTTDYTTAWNAALADIANGGILYIPPGTYTIQGVVDNPSGIILNSNIHIVGAGVGATVLKLKANTSSDSGAVIQIADYSNTDVRGTVERCSVSNLSIDGNKNNQFLGTDSANGVSTGIVVEDATYVTIENVHVYDCDGYGIGIVGSDLAHREDLSIKNVVVHDNVYDGFDVKSGFVRATIDNLRTYNNGKFLLGSDPITTTSSSQVITIQLPYVNDWLTASDTITLEGAVDTNGIPASEINTTLNIDSVDSVNNTVTATVASTAATSSGTGGGDVIYHTDRPITARDSVGLDLRGQYISVSNSFAYNNNTQGFRMRSNATSGVEFSNCHAYENNQDGFEMNGPDTLYGVMSNCYSYNNARYGLYMQGGHQIVQGCHFDDNDNMGCVISSGNHSNNFVGCTFSNNSFDGINVASSGVTVNVVGCRFEGNSRRGIDLELSQLLANGCVFDGNVEGILVDDVANDVILNGCSFLNNSGESIQYVGTNSGNFHYLGCHFDDTTDENGTLPTNRVVKHCIGLADT